MKITRLLLILMLATIPPAARAVGCTVSSTGVSLGSYTPNQALPADAAGSISVTCTKGILDVLPLTISYDVELSRGNSSGFSPRELRSGANTLGYNLYRDLLRTSVWGDAASGLTVHGSVLVPLVLGSGTATHTVYGRIFANQNATPGTYSDSIVVTVSY